MACKIPRISNLMGNSFSVLFSEIMGTLFGFVKIHGNTFSFEKTLQAFILRANKGETLNYKIAQNGCYG